MESRHARDGDEQADSNLLLNLVNEKLKRYVSVEDFEKDVGQAIDQRIRQARSTVKSVLFGAAVVLSVLAVDIY